uniref:Putative Arginase/deacetylase n=1 Tax=Moniliophthora roreri TaxID=221103 RepID=A0A0W0G4K1_MONRR
MTSSGATWQEKYGPQMDLSFTGPLSFSHLPYVRCLEAENENELFDIALLGMPFDTGVTHRPGARFGPHAIRSGSRREFEWAGYSLSWENNPYEQGSRIIDCGDVPVSPFDNVLAIDQMEVAYSTLLNRPVANPPEKSSSLDTWPGFPGTTTKQSRINHGTYFHVAHEEGLISNHSIHAGIRGKLGGLVDLEIDASTGFQLISADDIDNLGIPEIIRHVRTRVGNMPVYLSFDIDVIDPGLAPASHRDTRSGRMDYSRGETYPQRTSRLNFIGADLVEVAPAYDHAEITGIAAASLVHDFLSVMLADEPPKHDRVVLKNEF